MKVMALTVVAGLAASAHAGDCPGDCNGDGMASVLDFVCFQTEWQNQTEAGDCNGDGMYSILDFVCFQGEWQDFANGGCDGGGCDNGAPDALDDDFESYDLGNLCDQCGWEAWDLDAGVCAPVVDDQANSGTQSLFLETGDDLVQVFDITEGVWEVKAMTFVPDGAQGQGFFIMLDTYAHGGDKNWSMQVMMDPGLGIVEAQLQGGAIALIQTGVWVEIRATIDVDNNTVDIYYDDEQFVFGGLWNNNSIQCIDLYSSTLSFYYDDVSIQPVP